MANNYITDPNDLQENVLYTYIHTNPAQENNDNQTVRITNILTPNHDDYDLYSHYYEGTPTIIEFTENDYDLEDYSIDEFMATYTLVVPQQDEDNNDNNDNNNSNDNNNENLSGNIKKNKSKKNKSKKNKSKKNKSKKIKRKRNKRKKNKSKRKKNKSKRKKNKSKKNKKKKNKRKKYKIKRK